MSLSFAILCSSLVLYHSASCHLVPDAVASMLTYGDNGHNTTEYKRQTNSQLQCVSDRLDAVFQGNDASYVSGCKSIATSELELNPQPQINSFYSLYCIPECGNAINEAYDECGAHRDLLPGTERFNIDLCGTNQEGDTCYELYGDGLQLVTSERSCYETYISSDVCRCRSTLINGVAEQGCCIDAYHDFISGLAGAYRPRTLYRGCNVNAPAGCNNSPITSTTTSRDTTTTSRDSTTTSTPTNSNSSPSITSSSALLLLVLTYTMLG